MNSTANLVIRICFKSQTVSEERGRDEDIDALFHEDLQQPERLIDYVLAIDPNTNELTLACHDDDTRWDDYAGGIVL